MGCVGVFVSVAGGARSLIGLTDFSAVQLNPLDPSDLQPPVFPKRDKNNPNTLTTPSRATLTKREKIYQALWALQARLRENDIKYALKVGLGTGEFLLGADISC